MGLAMGCVGMSLDDFRCCTPFEFSAIFEAWQQKEEYTEHRSWDQARFLACSILQPYSKTRLKLTDVARFSWDTEVVDKDKEQPSTRQRFDEVMEMWGQ